MTEKIDTYCGLKCDGCDFVKECDCGGCIATSGKPFHGKCEIAECAKSRNVRFCGECGDFPCKIIIRYSNDDAHGDTPKGARIERCKQLKASLIKKARQNIDPISVCGHHCDLCFMGEWCGGCRSNYNCCSYATLFDPHTCPNVDCANEKGLDGCYDCPNLIDCKKGYYSIQNEYIAKATALFIKAHGKAIYTAALKRAVSDGLNYPRSFDNEGSAEGALALLEKYI